MLCFGEEDLRGKVPLSSHHFKGTYQQHDITIDVDHEKLVQVVFVSFLHFKVVFFPPFIYCILWKEVTMCSSHLRSGKLRSTALSGNSHIHFFEFFCMGRFVSSVHLFIYSIVYLYKYGLIILMFYFGI